jgi:photosystem II stability/assembly factor-like uncharacterized protein
VPQFEGNSVKWYKLAALVIVVLSSLGASAAVDPSSYQALQWRLIGPFRGGRVLTVTGIAGDDRHFYFGAVDGGVWATEDSGRTWRPIFDSTGVGAIGAIALAPSQPSTIYVGTGEADMRSDIAHGNGVFKSIDAGKSWTKIGLDDTRQIGRILIDPRNPDVVFVAALGHAYGANAERGVFRSMDGGAHWSKVLFLNNDTGAIDLAFRPGSPDTIYAALWQTRRPPWSVYPPSNGPGSGLYVSHDGGTTWSQVTGNGFPAHPGRMGIAVSDQKPDRVYVLADGPKDEGGLYRSDDDGQSWQHVTGDKRIWVRGWYFSGVTADPHNADRVFVMSPIVLRSDDGGAHFIALKGDPTGDDFHTLWIDPTNSERQILGTDQGTLITLNGGKSWSSWYNQPTAQIYHVSTDNRFPYWVYGAQQDSGAVSLPSRTDAGDGITMQQFHEVTAGGESGMIAPDPDDPDIVYGGKVARLDLRTNQTRAIDPTLAYPNTEYRNAWTLPLAFSRTGKKTLYFANQHLFETTDGGNHWARISPDLTRPDPGVPANLDAATAADDDHPGKARGVIYSIAPSPFRAGALWVGTDDGLVWRTDDDGKHWRNVTPSQLTAWSKVGGIEPSRFDANTVYLTIDRHRLEDDAPHIYRTTDGGKSWTETVHGIPSDSFVNVVREDPGRRALLYSGTQRGIYVSLDDGEHWQSLQQNLPITSVRDITVHGDDLVIATHGRGFWIMDNVTALRQMSGAAVTSAVLFKPADAIRVRRASFTGTPMPDEEPKAANPSDGAVIDYLLPDGVSNPVAIAILDAQNNTVRSFSSEDKPRPRDPRTLEVAPEWVPLPASVSTEPGMHRFVWDLHYPAAAASEDNERGRGVWAAPGRYFVELRVGGQAYRQPLDVKPDPRVKIAPAALARQFVLARKVEASTVEVGAALKEAGKLSAALSARSPDSGAQKPEIEALLQKIADLTGTPLKANPYASFNSALPRADDLKSLLKDFGRLDGAVDGADADPGEDALASYATLTKLLTATLAEWGRIKKGDLAELNAHLAASGQKAVSF